MPRELDEQRLTRSQVAAQAGITPATLKRWVEKGVIPGGKKLATDGWTPAAAAHARVVARLRDRGHTLEEIKEATDDGRLAYGLLEDLFPSRERVFTLGHAATETGLEPDLIERIWLSMGFAKRDLEALTEEDMQALRWVASVLAAGFPLVAFLQLTRVYGQSLSQIADAETRLFHIYVHEPLMREGVPTLEMAEEMADLGRDLLPLASPIMDYIHHRYLTYFSEQDVVGHMEADVDSDGGYGRIRVAIAFADLAGYTRYVEEEGEEEALSYVERFIDAVGDTLPEGARVVKTIGDEVMVVGQDAGALVDWAVGFSRLYADERPAPRIGINAGLVLYRDGDYYGREVNLASRVVARARGGEVLVTDQVLADVRDLAHLRVDNIGQVKLKGFSEPRSLCRVSTAD
ncbi:MAG TPA: adenylate cyclase regulatory domain-containing protein [Thermoleophilaceae bacterium]|jgi:adenylate cyclase|nr:adenylate cyclase regulatory domain-containing protein [Thermoleophilaceae bacterium]